MAGKLELEIRYGFVADSQSELLEQPAAEHDLGLKLFASSEDVRWSTGAGIRKALNYGVSAYGAAAGKYKDEMYQAILAARGEGKVPFRVNGHPDSFPDFLEQMRLIEMEFVV